MLEREVGDMENTGKRGRGMEVTGKSGRGDGRSWKEW